MGDLNERFIGFDFNFTWPVIFLFILFFLKTQNYTKMAKLQLISQMKIMEFSFQLIKSVCNVSIIIQFISFKFCPLPIVSVQLNR